MTGFGENVFRFLGFTLEKRNSGFCSSEEKEEQGEGQEKVTICCGAFILAVIF